MNRTQVLATLRAHEHELKDSGVVRLSLFGSTARGDAGPDSDVDLLAAFDKSRRLSLLDLVGIELRLADLLGVRVDLSEEGTLKPRVQRRGRGRTCLLATRFGAFRTFSKTSSALNNTRLTWTAVFVDDFKTIDAVERCLERISEASKKLGSVAEDLCPSIPWPSLRGLGNFLRHEYDRIEGDRLWFVIERDLSPLKTAAEEAIASLRANDTEGWKSVP